MIGWAHFVENCLMMRCPLSSHLAQRRGGVLVRVRGLRQAAVRSLDVLVRGVARHCDTEEGEREREARECVKVYK